MVDFVYEHATPPLARVGRERPRTCLAAGLVAEEQWPAGLPAKHVRNAKLVFRTSRVLDARPAGIYASPGPDPDHGGPRPKVGPSA